MQNRVDSGLEVELHDVFKVKQVTRGTELESDTAADLVSMDAAQASRTHRHNLAETVLYFMDGEATVFVNDEPHQVANGDRLLIAKGEWHSVSTPEGSGCQFLSVQTPPILDTATGLFDLEWRDKTA